MRKLNCLFPTVTTKGTGFIGNKNWRLVSVKGEWLNINLMSKFMNVGDFKLHLPYLHINQKKDLIMI